MEVCTLLPGGSPSWGQVITLASHTGWSRFRLQKKGEFRHTVLGSRQFGVI